ncbi:hypothetical protein MHZ92_11180 [Sporosarcina sp. ACRSL]|uniref:hypothetical protein n=1 Tax=Sporosarcina sp. ACRSL TaxID=2918215 RepID=UPI001EF68F0A|nr:hypothetical protein [Sporosarcina sp. ACRSL]MCG7344702.1 hypothetical protein [Sporosarcina sp. ACRSL]
MGIVALITFGLLVDWRKKKYRKIHQDAINQNAKSEESLNYTVEGDQNSPGNYL